MNPLTVAMLAVGGVTTLVGSLINGNISQKQFDREMKFKEKELDQSIASTAASLGLKKEELRQQWEQFRSELSQRKDEFAATMGFKNKELLTQNKQFQQTLGLQKESLGLQKENLAHTKFMDVINPILERSRKTQGILTGFTQMVKAGGGSVNPLGAHAPGAMPQTNSAPAAPANPITTGVA